MRVQVPLAKPQPWVLPVTVVCLALGALIALMLRLSAPPTDTPDPSMRPEEQVRYYKAQNDVLQSEVNKLRNKLNEVIDATASDQQQRKALMQELSDLRIRSGITPVEGPGIVITLDDSNTLKPTQSDVNANALIIHDFDLMLLVNELRSAGAEAISINDQRLVGSSAIRCVGPVINVNDRPVSAPFVVKAIGKSDTLYGAVNLPLGVLDQMHSLGSISINVVKKDTLRVPAMVVLPPLNVGRVVKDDKNPEDNGQ